MNLFLNPTSPGNLDQHTINIIINLNIRKTNDPHTSPREPLSPSLIMALLTGLPMTMAVDFNCQALLVAVKIEDIRMHRVLPAEFEIIELSSAQTRP